MTPKEATHPKQFISSNRSVPGPARGCIGATHILKLMPRSWDDYGVSSLVEEAKGGGSHEYAYEHAPDTELPIWHDARELARKIRDGERRRRH